MRLFDTTLTRLSDALDVRLVRHNVLAGNLANADTPGFSPKDVDFGAAMRAVSMSEEAGATAAGASRVGGAAAAAVASIVDGGGGAPSLDGNQVDVDKTMARLAENGLQYGASAKAAAKKLAILRYVASDGSSG